MLLIVFIKVNQRKEKYTVDKFLLPVTKNYYRTEGEKRYAYETKF